MADLEFSRYPGSLNTYWRNAFRDLEALARGDENLRVKKRTKELLSNISQGFSGIAPAALLFTKSGESTPVIQCTPLYLPSRLYDDNAINELINSLRDSRTCSYDDFRTPQDTLRGSLRSTVSGQGIVVAREISPTEGLLKSGPFGSQGRLKHPRQRKLTMFIINNPRRD